MATDPVVRFDFDFGAMFETAPLRVLEVRGEPPPAEAVPVPSWPRPRWLGRLLPVLGRDHPLRLEILGSPAPGFADHLTCSLASIYASAGAESGAGVLAWPGGLAAGWGGLDRLPAEASPALIACDLSAASVALARAELALRPGAWLVTNGSIRASLDLLLPAQPGKLYPLPLLGARELAAQAAGIPPALASRRFGRACAALASAAMRAHLLSLP